MNNAYSGYKATHYHKELQLFRDNLALQVYPRQIQVDPFNPCNHDCPFCIYRYHRDDDINALFNVKDWIQFDKLIEIFDSCVEMGTQAVEITGGGEPTLHPQAIDMFEAMRARRLQIGLVTNGCGNHWTRRKDRMVDVLKDAAWIRFSVDSATPDTHATVHKGLADDFWNVVSSISALVKAKVETCIIGMSFVVTRDNSHEIVDAAKMASDLGVDNIRFSAAIFDGYAEDYHQPHYRQALKDLEIAKSYERDDFTVFTFAGERMKHRESFGDYERGDFCYYSCLNAVIGADLNVYPCCVYKYRPAGVIASLKTQTLKQAWESEERRLYYENLNIAIDCKTCFLKPKNDFIKYLVEPEPLHVNFI